MIPYYVEYFFAPTAEALLEQSQIFYGDQDSIPIVLGSIGNSSSADARSYLTDVLDYEIQGTFAPSLAGKLMHEAVDIVTVHYPGSGDNVALGWSEWAGRGSVRAFWTIEVLGRSVSEANKGAATAPRILGEHLGFIEQFELTPEQARVSFWGWQIDGGNEDARADEFLTTTSDFLGDTRVELLDAGNMVLEATFSSAAEVYGYRSAADDSKTMLTITFSDQVGEFSGITIDKVGWSGLVVADMHIFDASGHAIEAPVIVEGACTYEIRPMAPRAFADTTSVVSTMELLE